MNEVLKCFQQIDLMAVVLASFVLVAVWLSWRTTVRRDMRFDFEDLLLDSKTSRASLFKLGQFICLALSSWAFVYLTLAGKLTEFFAGLYMAAWAGAGVLNKFADVKSQLPTKEGEPK